MSRFSTSIGRIRTLFDVGTREGRRTPVLLALLVFLPAYLVGVFTFVAPDNRVAFRLAGGEVVRTSLTKALPAFTTPMAAALLSGIAGLFLMQTSAAADSRLVVAGYRAHEVVLARLVLLTGVSLVGTTVAVGVMHLVFAPARLVWFTVAVLLTALIYGMIGVLVGVIFDRLPGVYLVMFGSMVDLFLFQNPLATDPPAVATYTPGHYPIRVAMDAGFSNTIEVAPLGWGVAVLGVLTLLGVLAFHRAVQA